MQSQDSDSYHWCLGAHSGSIMQNFLSFKRF